MLAGWFASEANDPRHLPVVPFDGKSCRWPKRVAIVGQPQHTGRWSEWRSIMMVHHDLMDLLPSKLLVLIQWVSHVSHVKRDRLN